MSSKTDITTEPPRLTESQLAFLIGSCRVWDPELHNWVPSREASARLRWAEAEIERLRAEVAALKAERDPLSEMWEALAEYQPMADRDGHGESWRVMCAERTAAAADAARAAAARAAVAAAAAEAIAAIRRARGVQP